VSASRHIQTAASGLQWLEMRTTPINASSAAGESAAEELPSPNIRWNFFTLASIQIVMRTGWIFKTESIVMPAIMDMLSGEAWLRGCLPMLNRFGLSIPPLIAAARIRSAKLKKLFLVGSVFVAAATFFGIATMFYFGGSGRSGWMTVCFLALYAVFFMAVGLNQLSFSTLQGKLIPVNQRGRLMMTSNVLGAILAIGFAGFLMPQWLWPDGGRFDLMCGFAGGCFLLSALIGLAIRECEDSFPQVHEPLMARVRETLAVFGDDKNFRRVALLSALFGCSFMLFPHYQTLGRERLQLDFDNLVWWVIIQNGGTALFSFLAGPIADSRGNRLVLRIVVLCAALAPLSAIWLTRNIEFGVVLFPAVFVLLGMSPVAIRTLNNYTLEICPRESHPKYLSAQGLCIAVPIFISPLVGRAIDIIGMDPVFYVISGLAFLGWLITFALSEPRHHQKTAVRLPLES
jgi:predicted MFS family arabinose efflux permease